MTIEHTIETKLGRITLRPTSASHIFADANHHSLSPQAADHHPPLTVNGVQITASGHFYLHADGTWGVGKDGASPSDQYNSLYLSKLGARSYNDTPSDAARRKIVAVLTPAVNEWALAHPHVILAAEDEHREELIARQQGEVKDCEAALVAACAKLEALIQKGGK